ncbi:GNAT family N-acetyltransferase [Oceanobacillus oncorhynchi]|uniref:GNAT family N-acetyltransferase n=1 Tax=Oceanobacillus oncorhynchi TaxID=545501 RepID=UPI002115E009|nr:GNAT family N-acetyltransferase [Oceanobacillus oncorhynchi]UUI38048.1 GNAT family N-acetyltransferase [Oceanobacillus oncorhynchi]
MEWMIRNINMEEIDQFASILKEVAEWLKRTNKEMWYTSELTKEALLEKYALNELFIGFLNGESAGTIIVQEQDHIFWPHENKNDALYLHKIAIRRKYAKEGVSVNLIDWAKQQAKMQLKKYIRLDCAADRPNLCYFYECQGFQQVGQKTVGEFFVALYEYQV